VLWTIGAVVCLLGALAAAVFAGFTASRGATPAIVPASPTMPLLGATLPHTPPPTATAAPEPTAEPVEYVRVANTGGQGIILRREPSPTAPRVAARAENTVLRVVGPDTTVGGRVWRQLEDAQGNRGWTPGEFLVPAPPPGG